MEHALATAASDTVKVAKFVETSVLPVLKKAQANQSTIESVTSLVSPQAANIERAGFAVLDVVINALDAAGAAAGANGLNVTLGAQLVANIKSIAPAVKGAAPVPAADRGGPRSPIAPTASATGTLECTADTSHRAPLSDSHQPKYSSPYLPLRG